MVGRSGRAGWTATPPSDACTASPTPRGFARRGCTACADPRTTMSYARARQNLDRHPNCMLAAYMGSGT